LTSSSHFVGPLIFALTFSDYKPTYGLIVLAFFLWGMASHAFGAVQDINADKAGDIGSVATVIGAMPTVRLSIALYAASMVVLIRLGWLGLVVAITETIYIVNIWPFRKIANKDAEASNTGWKRFIKLNQVMGFVVTLVLIYVFRFR
jgi:4-hydroxybenzoate polyprenyltransferase